MLQGREIKSSGGMATAPKTARMSWKGDKLYYLGRRSDYSIVQDEKYPQMMWRVRRPDGSLSDMVNRDRAKDAAMVMLDRDLKMVPNGERRPPIAQTNEELPEGTQA